MTFGVAVALPAILDKFDHFTGGSTGISFYGSRHQTGHGAGVTILGVHLSNSRWLYVLTWTIGAVVFLLLWWLLASSFGRSLRAVRDGELAAAASGISPAGYKVAAFGLSAAYAGVAGSLVAIDMAYVSPSSFELQLSLFLLVGAIVGLYGSIWGAVLGALLIEFLPDAVGVLPRVDTTQAGPTTFVYGAILIALMLVLPLVLRAAAESRIAATLVRRKACRRGRAGAEGSCPGAPSWDRHPGCRRACRAVRRLCTRKPADRGPAGCTARARPLSRPDRRDRRAADCRRRAGVPAQARTAPRRRRREDPGGARAAGAAPVRLAHAAPR